MYKNIHKYLLFIIILQSYLNSKTWRTSKRLSKRRSYSSVKFFEFLIGLDETPQENNSNRSQIEKEIDKECSKRDFVS